ncbi:hypothetical protein [Pseudoalteromonas agarivorans]|uniref:Uncharacterized protein n=1 Tax=Pseudoalteromonas agarivorans TaxID=176102 RepID=A0AAD0U6P8_9GAMM|nr:hypothetical protein [Pseudoalteromonas agarivorans]AYM88995.1 hypothetical protein D9T18_20060 [Pseudoalteromonas agarivorans]
MQSNKTIKLNGNYDSTDRKAELYEEMRVMLEEAGSRCTPLDSVIVISGVLNDIAKEHVELENLSLKWRGLLESSSSVRHFSLQRKRKEW